MWGVDTTAATTHYVFLQWRCVDSTKNGLHKAGGRVSTLDNTVILLASRISASHPGLRAGWILMLWSGGGGGGGGGGVLGPGMRW